MVEPTKLNQPGWSLTSAVLAVKVRVQSFDAHLVDLLDVATGHVLDELLVVRLRVDRLQLLVVHLKHLVDPPLVLQLQMKQLLLR